MDYMEEAIKEARKAMQCGEVPVGAVIVRNGTIISRAHNLKEKLKDVTAHAEILAIRDAEIKLDNWRLSECSMYVTLEPCTMCAAAIAQSRIKELYIGVPDIDAGACGSIINLVQNDYLNYYLDIKWQYNDVCSELLSEFFKSRRNDR